MTNQANNWIKLAFITLFNLLITHAAIADEQTPISDNNNAYQIQAGDMLLISVWKEEDLNREILVQPDNSISFPLIGNLSTHGLSVTALQTLLKDKIGTYIPDPVITVAVRQPTGNKIYVIGKVQRSGEFIATRRMDVMQALSMAGGTTPFASLNNIKILRRTGSQQIAIPFRYGDVEDGEKLEQNIILKSGDIVVVP
ncbi:MAG: polysaccharide export protein [Gammaproteobacteria bacterium]|nr:polysaccharide export protein [Gammaproteobacteria bacterium]